MSAPKPDNAKELTLLLEPWQDYIFGIAIDSIKKEPDKAMQIFMESQVITKAQILIQRYA